MPHPSYRNIDVQHHVHVQLGRERGRDCNGDPTLAICTQNVCVSQHGSMSFINMPNKAPRFQNQETMGHRSSYRYHLKQFLNNNRNMNV